jgi:hypothetical protein
MDSLIKIGNTEKHVRDLTLGEINDFIMSNLEGYDKFDLGEAQGLRENLDVMRELSDIMNLHTERMQNLLISSKMLFTRQLRHMSRQINILKDGENDDWIEVIRQEEKRTRLKDTVVSGFPIPVIRVATMDEIPDTNLYYVDSLHQFAIKINKVIFRGNIGNIITHHDERRKIAECQHGQFCKFADTTCGYYHDPAKMIGTGPRDIRNFTNASWIHHDSSSDRPTGRKIRGANTLETDLIVVPREELDLRNAQLMHDLLISLVAKKYTQ